MKSLHSEELRTIDVARIAGYSVQQVRNLERDGVVPPTTRTASAYRQFGRLHLHSVLAYRALSNGVGPVEAKRIIRALHQLPLPEVLSILDAAHAQLHQERRNLRLAKIAAAAISAEHVGEVVAQDSMSVSELADALGLRPSTLRHWDAEGLVKPRRIPPRGVRQYWPTDVRDARIVHQLRSAGYRIESLRKLMPEIRVQRRMQDLEAALASRNADITARSRALLDAAVEFSAILSITENAAPRTAGPGRPRVT